MLVVVADTGPLRYLSEIGHVEILPQLFEAVTIPMQVLAELRHNSTAISLGMELNADIILIDDRRALAVAVTKGLQVTGTLRLLIRAAQHQMLDLAETFQRLKETNFRYRPEMLESLLRQYEQIE
jgi:predicted nucleic acid-binding protein